MENLKELKKYVFHDIDIKCLNIDIERKEFKLSVLEVVESLNDYKVIEFKFEKITNLKVSECLFNQDSFLEIYSSELIEISEKLFYIYFNIINGINQPSSNISFKFENVIINDIQNE